MIYTVCFIGDEVFYIDCTNIPLEHLELIVREVYLPLMCTNQSVMSSTGGDKVMDVLHRLMSAVEITQGHVEVFIKLGIVLSKTVSFCHHFLSNLFSFNYVFIFIS